MPQETRIQDVLTQEVISGEIAAAQDAYEKLRETPLEVRAKAIECVKQVCESQAEELGRAGAQSLRACVRHIAHLVGQRLDPRSRGVGYVRPIPQGLRDRHHGNTHTPRNIL